MVGGGGGGGAALCSHSSLGIPFLPPISLSFPCLSPLVSLLFVSAFFYHFSLSPPAVFFLTSIINLSLKSRVQTKQNPKPQKPSLNYY